MKANMHRGKLIVPTSLAAGIVRQKQVVYEIDRIATQIDDKTRAERYPDVAEYSAWRESASRALKLFQVELRLLTEWIDARQNNAEVLLREAFEVLKVLEDQVDLKPHEIELVDRLEVFFEKEEAQKEATG